MASDEQAAKAWFEKARGRDASDYDGKIADYTEAIRLNANYAEAYARRGANLAAMGDVKGAMADFTQAIRINPRLPEAYNNRGSVRANNGDVDGGMSDFDEAVRLNPQNANTYFNRASLHEAMGDLDDAISDCKEAIRLNPKLAEAYGVLGQCYYEQERWAEALAAFEPCLAMLPEGAERESVVRIVEDVRGKVK